MFLKKTLITARQDAEIIRNEAQTEVDRLTASAEAITNEIKEKTEFLDLIDKKIACDTTIICKDGKLLGTASSILVNYNYFVIALGKQYDDKSNYSFKVPSVTEKAKEIYPHSHIH